MSVEAVSVILPVYNEAPVLAEVIDDVVAVILDHLDGSELIVVDDRSTDESWSIVEKLAAADVRIRPLRNDVNRGHGPSVRRGFDAATKEWIFHLDSDGQVDVGDFWRLWERRDAGDLVLGVRVRRHDPRHRLVLTRLTQLLVSALARRWARDANVPFKLVRRDLFAHLAPRLPADAFAPSILLLLGAVRARARMVEVPISHRERAHGRSTLRLGRLARAAATSAWQTVRFAAASVPRYPRR